MMKNDKWFIEQTDWPNVLCERFPRAVVHKLITRSAAPVVEQTIRQYDLFSISIPGALYSVLRKNKCWTFSYL